jgi:hypothetical protein
MTPVELLERWLSTRLPADAATWLTSAAQRLRAGAADRDLYLLTSLVSRHVGKGALALTAAELASAAESCPGWNPRDWTLDQAARIYLLLASTADPDTFTRRLDRLCSVADVAELVAFYRGLPLYPDQPRYVMRAAEGTRSNMRVVFEAVAHHNPYPAQHFAEGQWNQMVLKALFVGSALDPIVGLDGRRNPNLARMLCDYARERWAASRPVPPELWRCVGPFAAGPALELVRRLFERGTDIEREAAALALRDARDPEAARLLESHPALARQSRQGQLDWQHLTAVRN